MFPLIKLAKKLKDERNSVAVALRRTFPLIKLAKKLKAGVKKTEQHHEKVSIN